jgi:NTE family protein
MEVSNKRPAAAAATNAKGTGPANGRLPAEAYTEHPDVLQHLAELRAKFGEGLGKPGGQHTMVVSDVLDGNGYQYANLVQKGGGVLGIALVGYTHILEQAGIRFVRMAGTSAGAINTSLFTAVGDPLNPKAEAKSGRLLKYMSELDMFSFVDGHPFAKWMIRNFIRDKNFVGRVQKVLKGLTVSLALMFTITILLFGISNNERFEGLAPITRVCFVLTGLLGLVLLTMGVYMKSMLERLHDTGYGINPGRSFLAWIKARLDENGVSTVDALNKKASTLPPDLRLRNGTKIDELPADVTFITSELVTENKIEFPRMARLFRSTDQMSTLHPGEFVRASMSIPFFFESHIIADIPTNDPDVKKAWLELFNCNDVPEITRFIDGGVLSNFPINIFYNPRVAEARLPSFGIDLDDADPKADTGEGAASWPLGSFIGRMLNTIRYYYDKDFLLKNAVFSRGVGSVKLFDPKYNWLDFFLSDQTKLDLFLQGALAAKKFLLDFNWEDYKAARRDMQSQIQQNIQTPPPPMGAPSAEAKAQMNAGVPPTNPDNK